MYLHLSVSHSVHVGAGLLPQCMLEYPPPPSRHPPRRQTPWDQAPPGADPPQKKQTPQEAAPPVQCMLGDTVNKRAVRILLECNLVTFQIIFTEQLSL